MSKSIYRIGLTALILITSLATAVSVSYAQDGGEDISITGATTGTCGEITFTFNWVNGTPPYTVSLDYGDGDLSGLIMVDGTSYTFTHTYLEQGDYEWNFYISEESLIGLNGSFSEILSLEGPEVTLSSSPFPPLFVVGETGEVDFSTIVADGTIPYSYSWDLDGDGIFDGATGATASFAYTEVGKYYPQVLVTDGCGFTGSDTMPVVVADPEDACHPTAQKIADGVNTLFPNQSNDLYTCEDVYALFNNESEENNLGFGRMWKAYHLAESMEELTWEDILDWHLNQSGWGSLLQLDRFADLLEDHALPELMGLVMSEEYSLGDVRTAVRSVTRYEADFEDALVRIAEGTTPGELGQFYKLAADLNADVGILDEYLADGLTLAELKHTSKFADRMEADWTEVADARSEADSWGDINQAYHLATDEISAAEILITGVHDYKESLRGEAKPDREVKRAQQEEEKTQETAEKLAEQFSAEFGDVMSLLNGECEGDWACVRSTLRNQDREMSEGPSEKDHQTALQIASKYGFLEEEVLAYHKDYCGEDWACTRAYFREQYMDTKQTGKSNK
jgi:hypothetical protein